MTCPPCRDEELHQPAECIQYREGRPPALSGELQVHHSALQIHLPLPAAVSNANYNVIIIIIVSCMYIHVLLRDEKERRKKQARSNK